MRESVRKKYREIHDVHQEAEEMEVSTEEFNALRSIVFNFYSI